MPLRYMDASLVLAWLVPTKESEAVEEPWLTYAHGYDEFVSPPFLPVEALSAVRRLDHRGLLQKLEASGFVGDVLSLDIPTPKSPGSYQRAYEFAVRYNWSTVYDTSYPALTEAMSCSFFTLDRHLYNVAWQDFPDVRLLGQ